MMKEQIKEIEKDLGRPLTYTERNLVVVAFYKGHTIGHNDATEFALKLINKK